MFYVYSSVSSVERAGILQKNIYTWITIKLIAMAKDSITES